MILDLKKHENLGFKPDAKTPLHGVTLMNRAIFHM